MDKAYNWLSDLISKKWGGGITLLAIIGTLILTKRAIGEFAFNNTLAASIMLPLLIIAGVTVLIFVLAILTVAFWSLGLTDQAQPLGLPEGSIRAVISLALVVIFSILATYLYSDMASISIGKVNVIEGLTNSEVDAFLAKHQDIRNINRKEEPSKGPDSCGSPPPCPQKFVLTYTESTNTQDRKDSIDFAKQLLVLLGTLMTSVTSFYLGSKTSSAPTPTQTNDSKQPPLIRSIVPQTVTVSTGTARLKLLGDNLNTVKQVKIVNGSNTIHSDNVVCNDGQVECDIKFDAATAIGDWDVLAIDGSSRTAKLEKALKISP